MQGNRVMKECLDKYIHTNKFQDKGWTDSNLVRKADKIAGGDQTKTASEATHLHSGE